MFKIKFLKSSDKFSVELTCSLGFLGLIVATLRLFVG